MAHKTKRWFVCYWEEPNVIGYIIHKTNMDLNTAEGFEYIQNHLNNKYGANCVIINWKELKE